MKYEVDILDDENDNFEEEGDNVVIIKVFNKDGKDISENCDIQMYFNKNSLLGLGTELIRLAYHFKETKHIHIEPSEKDMQVQKMGIFLSPGSAKLTVICSENGTIDSFFD